MGVDSKAIYTHVCLHREIVGVCVCMHMYFCVCLYMYVWVDGWMDVDSEVIYTHVYLHREIVGVEEETLRSYFAFFLYIPGLKRGMQLLVSREIYLSSLNALIKHQVRFFL